MDRRAAGRAVGARCPHGAQHLAQPAEIGRESLVDRRVEGDLAGAVNDQVQVRRQLRHRGQIALDDVDPGQQVVDGRASAQLLEGRLGEQTTQPVATALPGTRADQYQQPGVGQVAQQPLEQGLADEPGDAGDQQPLARQPLPQHHLGLLARLELARTVSP